MDGEHITVRIFFVLWVSFVSLFPCLGTWYLSDLPLGNIWCMHAFLSLQRTWLPSLICQLSTGSLPSRECFYSQFPSSCLSHTSFSPFFPPLPAHWPTLVPVLSSRSLETWRVCFHSLWNMYTLAPLTSSFYIYTLKYSAMKNFGTPVMMFKGHYFLIPKPWAKPWDIQVCPLPFCLWPWTESLAVVFASHSL